jgi:hypothetical protein
MVHKHSPEARERRHRRAVELGFFMPVDRHSKLIAVPKVISADDVSRALATHRAANRAKHAWVLPVAAIERPIIVHETVILPEKSTSPPPIAAIERPIILQESVDLLAAQVLALEARLVELSSLLKSHAVTIVAELSSLLKSHAAAIVSQNVASLEGAASNFECVEPQFAAEPQFATAPAVAALESLIIQIPLFEQPSVTTAAIESQL